jgi:hypothetical protein
MDELSNCMQLNIVANLNSKIIVDISLNQLICYSRKIQ